MLCYSNLVNAGNAALAASLKKVRQKTSGGHLLSTRFFSIQALSVWLLPGLLLSTLSARAEPPPSQDFWNYLVEFGDAQGELFDPSDYAAVANIPAQSLQPESPSERAPAYVDKPAASATQEQLP